MDVNEDRNTTAGADAAALAEQLNALDHVPAWREAGELGVELVDHPDSQDGILHLASGDVVYPTESGYEYLEAARWGWPIASGTMHRVHVPGVASTARIHPSAQVHASACIEHGAVIAPRAYVGADAHVGLNAHVGRASHVGAGVFIGPNTVVRAGSMLGEGSVIGAGSEVGGCTRVGEGAQVAQRTIMDAHSVVTAGEKVDNQSMRRASSAPTVARAVEHLLSMDRD